MQPQGRRGTLAPAQHPEGLPGNSGLKPASNSFMDSFEMNYSSVIAKFDQLYRRASLEEILSIWGRSKTNLNVYVHNPFCPSICKYCYYRGAKFSLQRDSNLYDRYYSGYLPKAVAPFLHILDSREIGSYFFGGGTPSLMKPETMRFVFDLFPGFKNAKSRTIEIHPAFWTEEQLDILAEYGFTCCILGIQSFDESLLRRQNRIFATIDTIKHLAKGIKDRGMYLAADLIYRMDSINSDEIFQRDLDTLLEFDIDIISLQHNFVEISDDKYIDRFFSLIHESTLVKHYRWEDASEDNPVMSIDNKKKNKACRYLSSSISHKTYADIFKFAKSIAEGSKYFFNSGPRTSLLGFGSYKNPSKNTFSSIFYENAAVEYIEVNNNWTPEYYITFDEDRGKIFGETMEVMRKFKSLEGRPAGISFAVINSVVLKDAESIFRKPYVAAGIEISWEDRTPEVDEFVEKLKNNFPYTIESPSSIIVTQRRPVWQDCSS